ncbi:hypothetical protein ES332_D06G069200v1 [Gossypium tomentosum]|uniref:Major facilitator superfamily (MFS) profile domain-containing protein n=1 Tax=Gossypium tomentosum TaxID=34277 RepID=A0A5D2KF90_GOSTO|nr:hypothetical protein ES332_D06G069200v1 [Gossypium tomentosum]
MQKKHESSTGVLVCILRIITKISLPQTPQDLQASAHFYFIVTTALLLSCTYSGFRILFCSVYDVADFTGKSLTAIYVMQSIKKASQSCISRLLFYPVFTACLHGPEWLKDEVLVVVVRFMLGLTNGYLTSVPMILGPKSLPVSEAELSAIALVVFLGIGLVSGSVLGWYWII